MFHQALVPGGYLALDGAQAMPEACAEWFPRVAPGLRCSRSPEPSHAHPAPASERLIRLFLCRLLDSGENNTAVDRNTLIDTGSADPGNWATS